VAASRRLAAPVAAGPKAWDFRLTHRSEGALKTLGLITAALAVLALSGCSTLGCGGAANSRAEAGACSTHISFLRQRSAAHAWSPN
jgi:hypothetical protein